ncbi:sodium:solute symporter family protein, partial [candidate division KSB1 bacterium]|nr:sodium:solute symporter family protein [candidate division KSB1 bacterium]
MLGLPLIDVITIITYFLFVILIGIWASRRIQNQEDYFLGGRRFGKFVQTFAAFGQGTSVESAVGMSVLVARNGIAGIWTNLTSVFGLPIYWITSVWYRRMRLLTLGDFFEERFNSKGLAALYALISSVFFMIVVGLGFTAMTKTITAIAAKPVEQLSIKEQKEYQLAIELERLEETDIALLNANQLDRLEQLRIQNPRKEFSFINEAFLMWGVALIVIFYAALGGLEAAFLTDTLQGIFILILSVLLFPFAYFRILRNFNESGLSGIIDAAKSQLPEAAFEIWGSPAMIDFTWYYMLALLIMGQINVAIQANQLTACGSARDEYTARFGFTTGIFMKRATTLLWGVSALLLVILYTGTVKDPDYLWGYACRDLLGSVGFGLVGLMIACLMAALMSTADMMMITTSSLLTHNLVRPFFPNLLEKKYIHIGRIIGFFVVIGGVLIASQFDNVFYMMKIIWEFNIVMAASFWLGLKWRRATKAGAWASMASALIFFVILQVTIPLLPGAKTHPYLAKTIELITVERVYQARQVDVEARQKEIELWDQLNEIGKVRGERPMSLEVGEKFSKKYNMPQKSIFWTQGLKLNEQAQLRGSGMLSLELVIVDWLGFDLSKNPYALNETIRIIIRTLVPFLILILVSY